MAPRRCGLCGRAADEADLMWLRGLKGAVCRPGRGCDTTHPGLAAVRNWLAGSTSTVPDDQVDDIMVDNPKHH